MQTGEYEIWIWLPFIRSYGRRGMRNVISAHSFFLRIITVSAVKLHRDYRERVCPRDSLRITAKQQAHWQRSGYVRRGNFIKSAYILVIYVPAAKIDIKANVCREISKREFNQILKHSLRKCVWEWWLMDLWCHRIWGLNWSDRNKI